MTQKSENYWDSVQVLDLKLDSIIFPCRVSIEVLRVRLKRPEPSWGDEKPRIQGIVNGV